MKKDIRQDLINRVSVSNKAHERMWESVSESSKTASMGLVKSAISEQSKFSPMFYNSCYYQIRSGKLLKYEFHEFRAHKQREQLLSLNSAGTGAYCGEISAAAQKNLKKKIEIWFEAIQLYNDSISDQLFQRKRKFTFLTVTLSSSQFHSDQEIKELILKPFLRKLKSKYEAWNYIWKAEKQINGNIHFHIILDVYIDKIEVQELWNGCQENLGYVSEFAKKFKHFNPPSTKIEGVNSLEAAIQYLSKYLAKDESHGTVEGAIWKASKSVSSLNFFEFVSDFQIDYKLDRLVDEGKITYNSGDHYAFYNTDTKLLEEILPYSNLKQWDSYKSYLTDYLFGGDRDQSFHFHAVFTAVNSSEEDFNEPLIAQIEYPEPIQLKLFDQSIITIRPSHDVIRTRYSSKLPSDEKWPEWIEKLCRG